MAGADDAAEQRVTTLVSGEETDGRLALLELREVAGREPPRHVHEGEDEIVYVLAGELTFFVGEEAYPAVAGACLFLPRGTEHAYAVESGEALLLVLLTPAGLEGGFEELAAERGGRDVERLITTAAKYGVTITAPPPMPRNQRLAPAACGPETTPPT